MYEVADFILQQITILLCFICLVQVQMYIPDAHVKYRTVYPPLSQGPLRESKK
jgi:hypothetical protein